MEKAINRYDAVLTEREKDCLQGVLDRKTAKEMALELGISHHAVEKRLKRARQKLKAHTSIEAARIFAETCGQTAYGSSALSQPTPLHDIATYKAAGDRGNLLHRGLIMSISALALLFLIYTGFSMDQGQSTHAPSSVERVSVVETSPSANIERAEEDQVRSRTISEIVRGQPMVAESDHSSTVVVVDPNKLDQRGQPYVLTVDVRGGDLVGPGVIRVHESNSGALTASMVRDD